MLRLCLLLLSGTALAAETRLAFHEAQAEMGIVWNMTSGKTPSREILEVNGGGVALLDHDNDGDLDLFFANGATLDRPEGGPGSRLYENLGDGTFEDVTRRVGIDLGRWAMGAAVGDVDGDGRDDLYVTCYGRNVLFRNVATENGPRFVDVTHKAGVGDPRWSTSAAFGDLDGDGDLDLYVANYMDFDPERPPPRRTFKGVPVFGGPMGTPAAGDVAYENLGDGRFRDVTRAWGLSPESAGYGLGVLLRDFDADSHLDVFVGNDSTTNFLFRRGEDGKFRDTGYAAGVACNHDGRSQATMGIASGDVDGDGRPDLFTTNFSSDTNTLHLNRGRGLFEDRTSQYGLAAISRPFLSWGTGLFDFDADGDEDLFVASGHIYPEVAGRDADTEYEQPILLLERAGRRFARVERGEVFSRRYSGRSAAFGDLDDDGDVDIVMTTLNGPVTIFRNDARPGPALVVELLGDGGNHRGIGALVELRTDPVQRRWIGGGSYQSWDATRAYFGLPGVAKADLRIVWPGGSVQEVPGVPVNRRVLVRRADGYESSPLRRP